MPRDREPDGQEGAAQIQWIARTRVRSGGGEFAIFAEMAGCQGADNEPESGESCARGDPVGRGRGQGKIHERDGIAEAHAPAHPEFSLLMQGWIGQGFIKFLSSPGSRIWPTASVTSSTVIASIAGE